MNTINNNNSSSNNNSSREALLSVSCALGTDPNPVHFSSHLILSRAINDSHYYYFHATGQDAEERNFYTA